MLDNEIIIYIFEKKFKCSFKSKSLIKNGVGNRPVDTVAAGLDFVKMSGAKSCP